jgi:G patch domain-containing protein 1
LTGFVLSEKPVAEDRWWVSSQSKWEVQLSHFLHRFPLPDVPKGWSPNPKRIWDKNKENIESSQQPQDPSQPVPHAKWRAGISADEVRLFNYYISSLIIS